MSLNTDEEKSEKTEDDSGSRCSEELRMVLIGQTGSGKSASGNTILGRRHFLSQISARSVTQICQLGSVELSEDAEEEEEDDDGRRATQRVAVVDMPGFGDTHLSAEQTHAEVAKCVSLSAPGPHAFLLAVPLGRYTENENRAVGELAQIFGEDAVRRHVVVLFTRGDELEGMPIEEYLRETAPAGLRDLLDRCGGRYHVLNNKDPQNRAQVKGLLTKVKLMVEQNNGGFYTNSMFLEAEAAIREEQRRMLRERGQAEGEEEEEVSDSKEEEAKHAKRRKCDLDRNASEGGSVKLRRREFDRGSVEGLMMERWMEESRGAGSGPLRDRFRGRRRSSGGGRSQGLRLSLSRLRREAALSAKVLDRLKILVAAGATGVVVGAALGAAAPLAAAAGASLAGNAAGFAAGQLAGMSAAGGAGVGKAVGAIVAAASGKTAVALGAVTGGVLGGSVGIVAGTEADSPREGAVEALSQVSLMGASVVGVSAGVGCALGAGAALGAALEGAALASPALGGAETAAAVAAANATQGSLALASTPHAAAAASGLAAPVSCTAAASDPWATVAATTRVMSVVAEIGKAVAGVALAGGLVVKVVKEKVRCGGGETTEKKSYEIHWNK